MGTKLPSSCAAASERPWKSPTTSRLTLCGSPRPSTGKLTRVAPRRSHYLLSCECAPSIIRKDVGPKSPSRSGRRFNDALTTRVCVAAGCRAPWRPSRWTRPPCPATFTTSCWATRSRTSPSSASCPSASPPRACPTSTTHRSDPPPCGSAHHSVIKFPQNWTAGGGKTVKLSVIYRVHPYRVPTVMESLEKSWNL